MLITPLMSFPDESSFLTLKSANSLRFPRAAFQKLLNRLQFSSGPGSVLPFASP